MTQPLSAHIQVRENVAAAIEATTGQVDSATLSELQELLAGIKGMSWSSGLPENQ